MRTTLSRVTSSGAASACGGLLAKTLRSMLCHLHGSVYGNDLIATHTLLSDFRRLPSERQTCEELEGLIVSLFEVERQGGSPENDLLTLLKIDWAAANLRDATALDSAQGALRVARSLLRLCDRGARLPLEFTRKWLTKIVSFSLIRTPPDSEMSQELISYNELTIEQTRVLDKAVQLLVDRYQANGRVMSRELVDFLVDVLQLYQRGAVLQHDKILENSDMSLQPLIELWNAHVPLDARQQLTREYRYNLNLALFLATHKIQYHPDTGLPSAVEPLVMSENTSLPSWFTLEHCLRDEDLCARNALEKLFSLQPDTHNKCTLKQLRSPTHTIASDESLTTFIRSVVTPHPTSDLPPPYESL